ncbi:MAG: SpoIIE family protein phosphatase [Bacteroidota bacterium]
MAIVFIYSPGHLYGQQINPSDQKKIDEYKQLIEEHQDKDNKNRVQEYSNKLAFIYWQNQYYKEAINYFKKSLNLNKELGNTNGVQLTNYYMGMTYSENDEYDKAIQHFREGVKISKELGKKSSLASGLVNIAQAYQDKGELKKSNEEAMKALEIAKQLEDLKFMRSCYGLLAENHEDLGNSEQSMKYFDLFSSIDKHIKNEEVSEIKRESQEEISRAQSEKSRSESQLTEEKRRREETEDSLERAKRISRERQMQLELQEMELKKQQAQLKLEQTIRNSFIFGFVLISIFAVLLFYFYRQKKKANLLLSEQNEKINNQNRKIEEQRNKLQIQNTKLNDSINYAQNIQTAILPQKSELEKFFDVFVLFKPKDIVSGDFYWFTEVKNDDVHKIFLAAVDCTGHGVPGAFMSMIGNRMLNEIISEKEVYEPAKILALLNEHIIEALNQEHSDNTDGMDACLISMDCSINNPSKISFAGAKRPLYYYSANEKTIHTIKGTRNSIGGYDKKRDTKHKQFSNHELNLQKGDILYLTSDGITDQVNSKGKRFSSKRLFEFFNNHAENSLEKQKNELDNLIEQFKMDTEQRDDIIVIGAKIR